MRAERIENLTMGQFKTFLFPLEPDSSAEEELNGFLRGHRVVDVQRVCFPPRGWCFCVEWIDGSPGGGRGKADRPDRIAFAANLHEEIEALREGLLDGTCPIGNYVQFTIHDPKERVITAAPFREYLYLDGLDRKWRPYVRYMDDFIVWADDREALRRVRDDAKRYAANELGLEIKAEPIVNRTAHGMDFLGMRVVPAPGRAGGDICKRHEPWNGCGGPGESTRRNARRGRRR